MLRYLTAVLIALVFSIYPALADKRVALVIGNSKYITQNPLDNPGRDARLIGNILKDRGFTLVKGGPLFDLDLRGLNDALETFATTAQNADVAFVYYSGHGMQIGGSNYLFPVDSPLLTKYNVSTKFVNANLIINQFANANSKLNILLLDACRNNPFDKGEGGGLAPMQAAYGTIIGFATQPGNTALDGSGNNSPYATALSKAMQTPGLELFDVLRQTAVEVTELTNREQQPWFSTSPIKGRFYFTQSTTSAPTIASAPVTSSIAAVVQPSTAPVQPTVVASANPMQGAVGTGISLTQQGYELMRQGRFMDARDVLSKAVQLDPSSAEAQTYLGFSWLFIGRAEPNPHLRLAMYRTAGFPTLDTATSLVQANPAVKNPGTPYRHRAEMILETAKALLATGQRINNILDGAIADLLVSIKLDPNAMPGYSREALARAYRLQGDAYNPDVDPTRSAKMYVLNRAKARESYLLALNAYNDLNRFNPKYAAAYDGRCYLNMRLGNGESAARPDALEASRRSDEYKNMQCLNPTQPWGQVAMRSVK